jgi:hypothetical protein
MKRWIVGAAIVLTATSASAQEPRPLSVEVGIVMGLVQPYLSFGVVAGPVSVRASGGAGRGCDGQQVNLGWVLRDQENAKHTMGAVWGRFHDGFWYGEHNPRTVTGRYVGLAYSFQVRGFFLEFGPAFGAANPVGTAFGRGPLTRVFGQLGYVHRFGKKYLNDDE